MNQDKVKEILLSIEDAPLEFTVVFSGKQSKKVNGLYKSDTREILIHNRNFNDDNLLIYTAIHEYAHHLHACRQGGSIKGRAHTAEFWAILHGLLAKGEEKGVYRNVFDTEGPLKELTDEIKKKYLYENGNLFKELGKLLLKARELCEEAGGRFEDYIDRVLCLPRVAAKTAMKVYQYNINPSMGADNMKLIAGIRSPDQREAAESAILGGKSPDEVRMQVRKPMALEPEDDRLRLEKEKVRLERTIQSLSRKLEEVEAALEQV